MMLMDINGFGKNNGKKIEWKLYTLLDREIWENPNCKLW